MSLADRSDLAILAIVSKAVHVEAYKLTCRDHAATCAASVTAIDALVETAELAGLDALVTRVHPALVRRAFAAALDTVQSHRDPCCDEHPCDEAIGLAAFVAADTLAPAFAGPCDELDVFALAIGAAALRADLELRASFAARVREAS